MLVGGTFQKLIMKDGGVIEGGSNGGISVGGGQVLGDIEISGKGTKISGGNNASGIYVHGNNTRTKKIEVKDGAVIYGDLSGIELGRRSKPKWRYKYFRRS
ncbi:hypothetical protein [Helicobacter mesocricetorum]|uniref:hypothetical protein n=1 Tax=Helicobacter mesocricetorum TaxID=87012 RepID=UPI000CF09D8B|nr:hypothetical protein [Helicobacter mesocricetorum]